MKAPPFPSRHSPQFASPIPGAVIPSESKQSAAVRWAKLFPAGAARRLMAGVASLEDIQAVRTACVQGMLEDLRGAFNWHEWMCRNFPMEKTDG